MVKDNKKRKKNVVFVMKKRKRLAVSSVQMLTQYTQRRKYKGGEEKAKKEKVCTAMDEYDILLLSAIHKGDVTSIQTYLSSMSDPNVYLNRVYDEPNEQKCTLLMIACLNGYEDIVYMLLNYFKPDLEVLNIIKINNKDKKLEIYYDVTVLWAATAINHFLIVKRLVEQGACVNHRTSTNSTPVRCACYNGNIDMVRYLVENDADIHIAKNKNETNLALSVHYQHIQLAVYLVDELGCDVNECDDDGRSALYFAVKCGSLETVQFLLKRGARNVPPTCNRMSPLMLAADHRHSDIMDAISLYCSSLEWIEAEELLGSAFACTEYGLRDLQQSFEHYYRALQLRSIHSLPKVLKESTIEVFNHRQECQTVEQLEELRLNPENMYIEALLVRQRLLGPANEAYRYSVINRGASFADNEHFHQAIALWLYALELCRQYSISIDPEDLRLFVVLFSDMLFKSSPIPIEVLLTIIATTVEEVKHNTEKIDYNLHTLLFFTTIISQPSVDVLMSTTDRRVFYRLLHSINEGPYITRAHGSALLHLSLSDLTSILYRFMDHVCEYPCLCTVRKLLHCGADVNAIDATGNTPLHILASNSSVYNETILQLLCDAGAHLDYTNVFDDTPIDIALNSNTKQLLKTKMKISLKCLCARLIRKNYILFHGKIATSLVNFVERH